MANSFKNKSAFTLLEVMVAVMIITVVIMALYQMYANNNHIFISLKQQTKGNQYASFFIANEKYGWEKDDFPLYRVVEEFDLESDLRREFKEIQINTIYKELKTIDMSESDEQENAAASSDYVFEIGQSVIKTKDTSTALIRFKVQ